MIGCYQSAGSRAAEERSSDCKEWMNQLMWTLVLFQSLFGCEVYCMWKNLHKVFCGSGGSCAKSEVASSDVT